MSKVSRKIHIQYGTDLADHNEQQSIKFLTEIIQGILTDHGIDIHYTVEFSEDQVNSQELSIIIEDRPVRIVKQHSVLSWREPHNLTMQIAESLFANRSLLLPPKYIQQLWDGWVDDGSQYPDGFSKLLTGLIFRGVNISRLADFTEIIHTCADMGNNFDELFETSLASLSGQRINIQVSRENYQQIYDEHGNYIALPGDYGDVQEMLKMMGDGLFYELGLVYRLDGIEVDDSLVGSMIRFKINDLHTPEIPGLEPGEFLVNDSADRLTLLNIKGADVVNPANGAEAAIVKDTGETREFCEQCGLTTWDTPGCILLLASHIIRRFAGALLNTNITDFMMDRLAISFPDLVSRTKQVYGQNQLTRVLRDLLDEEISIRDLRSILECILSYQGEIDVDFNKYIVFLSSPGTVAPRLSTLQPGYHQAQPLTESVRIGLKRYLSHKYTRSSNTLVVYLLDPKLESRLIETRELEPLEHQYLIAGMDLELDNLPPTAQLPVILTTTEVRLRLRYEIEKEYPRVAVVSYQELSPDMNIQPLARIKWYEEENN